MEKGTKVKDKMTGKTGVVKADLGIFIVVIMDEDGEIRNFALSMLEEI